MSLFGSSGTGGSGVGLTDVLTTLQNGVRALGTIGANLAKVFPQSGGTSTSATSGSAGAPPATVEGYLEVTVNGAVVKIPYYQP